jgi:hypothetical protein
MLVVCKNPEPERDKRFERAGWLAAMLGFFSFCGLTGCTDESRVPVYPVSGQIKVQGEVPEGAFLVFHPKSEPAEKLEVPKPAAKVKSDGSFQLTTYAQGDGAPAGNYSVTIEWYPLVKSDGEVKAGPNVIPSEYAKPESTPWTATVEKAPTEIKPVELKRAGTANSAPRPRADGRIRGED